MGGYVYLTQAGEQILSNPASYRFQIACNTCASWVGGPIFKRTLESALVWSLSVTSTAAFTERRTEKEHKAVRQAQVLQVERLWIQTWLPSHWEGGHQVTRRTSDQPRNIRLFSEGSCTVWPSFSFQMVVRKLSAQIVAPEIQGLCACLFSLFLLASFYSMFLFVLYLIFKPTPFYVIQI